jgi:NAD(P)H-dependent FMN reductase
MTQASATRSRIAHAIADTLRAHGGVHTLACDPGGLPDLAGIDLLVIGGPTHRHGLSPIVEALLDALPESAIRGRAVAAFDTRYHMSKLLSGSAASKIAKRLRQLGGVLVVPPESFFVMEREGPLENGEIDRAARWAETLQEQAALHTC